MLYIVLLITQVTCEWVEISQNYHRINSFWKDSSKTGEDEINIFTNTTVPDPQWNKGVIDRIANVGNIKKVPLVSVKSPSIIKRPDNNYLDPQMNFNFAPKNKEHTTIIPVLASSPIRELNKFKTNEVQFDNSMSNRKVTTDKTKINFGEEIGQDTLTDNDDTYKWVHVRTEPPTIADQNIRESVNYRKNIPHAGHGHEIKYNGHRYNISKIQEDLKSERFKDVDYDMKDFSDSDSDAMKSVQTKTNNPEDVKKVFASIQAHIPETNKIKKDEKMETLHLSANYKDPSDLPDMSFIDKKFKDRLENDFPKVKPGVKTNSTDSNSLDKMLKMVKNIADIISKNTKLGFKGKVDYLEDLKSTILATIEERIDHAWPDDGLRPRSSRSPYSGRSARVAAPLQARGHVEFPSSESALMTISFLTFAVFLIKLVLQVIHAYKSKAMMVTPAVVAAVGRAAAAYNNKN